jgi:hypothetical protein
MAMPLKAGIDYFPHDTDAINDEKIEAMRAEYGNDGYAFYFILLERIYKKNGVLDVQNAGKTTEIPHKEKKSKVNNNTPIIPQGIDARFQEFWNAYPNKVGKGAAEKAFKKIKPAVSDQLLSDMLTALSAQKQSEKWQRDNGQYIPNPSTWLNQRRWEDEPPQQENTGQSDSWGGIPEL